MNYETTLKYCTIRYTFKWTFWMPVFLEQETLPSLLRTACFTFKQK